MIHFDFDNRYQDENVVGSAISRREGVVVSVVFHVLLAAALLYVPQLSLFELSPEELERRRAEMLERMQDEPPQRFVFVPARTRPSESARAALSAAAASAESTGAAALPDVESAAVESRACAVLIAVVMESATAFTAPEFTCSDVLARKVSSRKKIRLEMRYRRNGAT